MSVINELFTERFRPKELSTLILPDRIRNEFKNGLIQNVLLYGGAGSGKTSLGYILSSNHTTLYINASSERGIDVIRERISRFCSTLSLDDEKDQKLKCVFLDEYDGATEDFHRGLRSVLERYSSMARFIATANYIQKIPEPIQSRFNCISFDPINFEEEEYLIQEYKNRTGLILSAAKITYTEEILHKFVHNDFPDFRRILNKVQSFYLQGIKELNSKNFNINFDFVDLFELCLKPNNKPYENYKIIVGEYSSKIDDALNALSSDFIEYINTNAPTKIDKIPLIMIAIAEYQYQKSFVIDPMVTLLAAIFKLQTILNS